jgi:poly(A) polymerase
VTENLDSQALGALLRHERLRVLLEALNGDGEETRLVGGAVRNSLLGRPVTDRDCATTATPDVTMRRAEAAGFKPVPTGMEHGTVTVVVEGEPFEVTTLREDVKTDGRRAVVRFGRDFAADARRRDFTINALSVSPDGRLHDYTGGVADLAARRVRFIGDARNRIREDFLRILRFFRFHAEYGAGEPDPAGLEAAVRERAGLAGLSHERIRTELLKLLAAPRAVATLERLAETGLLTLLLGGVGELGRFTRVAAFEGASPDPVRRLAALAVMTPEDADRLRERLRLSNGEHRRLAAYGSMIAILKTRPLPIDAAALRPLVAEHGVEPIADALRALAGEPRPEVRGDALAALRRFESGDERVPVFPLRGGDLVARGIEKGPRVGELMALARRAWLAEGCPTDPDSAQALLERTLDLAAPRRFDSPSDLA